MELPRRYVQRTEARPRRERPLAERQQRVWREGRQQAARLRALQHVEPVVRAVEHRPLVTRAAVAEGARSAWTASGGIERDQLAAAGEEQHVVRGSERAAGLARPRDVVWQRITAGALPRPRREERH